jgi:hypothetical protein
MQFHSPFRSLFVSINDVDWKLGLEEQVQYCEAEVLRLKGLYESSEGLFRLVGRRQELLDKLREFEVTATTMTTTPPPHHHHHHPHPLRFQLSMCCGAIARRRACYCHCSHTQTSSTAADRLANRGGVLLREERFRKAVAKEMPKVSLYPAPSASPHFSLPLPLPLAALYRCPPFHCFGMFSDTQLERELVQELGEWEGTHQKYFLAHGVRLLDGSRLEPSSLLTSQPLLVPRRGQTLAPHYWPW